MLFALFAVFSVFSGDSSAQRKNYQWVSYDTTQSDLDTASDGSPARYIQQYDSAKIERISDSLCHIWIRTKALTTSHLVSWHEQTMIADSLFSSYSYAASRIEIDRKEQKFRTWQWMYYDVFDNPVAGLKINRERPMTWYPLTLSLKKLLRKLES